MELVGVVAAGQQFIIEGVKLIRLIRDIRDKYKDAPDEIGGWSAEIEDLLRLVEKVEATPSLAGYNIQTAIEGCRKICAKLNDDLLGICFSADDSRAYKTWKAIRGVDKEEDLRKQFEELQRFKMTLVAKISLAQFNQGHLIAEDIGYIKKTIQPGSEEDKCVQDLFLTDPEATRDGITTLKGRRVDGTCEWITSTKEYTSWASSPSGLLWLFGSPGKGKTFLSIFLTEHLQAKDGTVIFFFCDNKIAARNTAMGVLRGIIHQLVQAHPQLVSHLVRPWKVQKGALFTENGFDSLWQVFVSMVGDVPEGDFYCVLDGLDECVEESLRRLLLKIEALFEDGARHSLRMVILSRKYPSCLEDSLGLFPKINLDSGHGSKVEKDIDAYISSRVKQLAQRKRMTAAFSKDIESNFREKSKGTFLWVSFLIQDFQSKSIAQIEKDLDSLPQGLDEVYERILLLIKPEDMKIIANILQWVTLTNRALNVVELAEAIGIRGSEHLSKEDICLGHLESCGHLLQIGYNEERAESADSGSDRGSTHKASPRTDDPPTVALVHQSAKDFLIRPPRNQKLASFQVVESAGSFAIADHLLRSMQTIWLRKNAEGAIERDPKLALTQYAAHFCEEHLRSVDEGSLLRLMDKHKSFFSETSEARDCWFDKSDVTAPQPLLHFAVACQLVPLVEKVLRRKRLNPLSFQKYLDKQQPATPLALAVDKGNLPLVELLLKFGATVDLEYTSPTVGDHVMRLSCTRGFVEVFKALAATKGGARCMKREVATRKPLNRLICYAAAAGSEPLCRLLLERHGYSIDAPGEDGVVPAATAIRFAHYDLLRVMLDKWGASIGHPDHVLAALAEQDSMVDRTPVDMDLIYGRGRVDINHRNAMGQTVLHATFENMSWTTSDRYEFIRQCLAYGCDPSIRTNEGDLPFHRMPCFMHHPGSFFRSDRTPSGSKGLFPIRCLVLLLLDSRVSINAAGRNGYTLLHRFVEDCFDPKVSEHKIDQPRRVDGLSKILDLGADRHARTARGLTPKELARHCHAQKTDLKDREGYCQETLDDLVDVLDNYATVTDCRDNLRPLDYEYAKEARSEKGAGPFGVCSVM